VQEREESQRGTARHSGWRRRRADVQTCRCRVYRTSKPAVIDETSGDRKLASSACLCKCLGGFQFASTALRALVTTQHPPSTSDPQLTATRPLHPRERPSESTAAMSRPSAGPFINARPWLRNWVQPLANWYNNAAGYRQLGLKYERLPNPLSPPWGIQSPPFPPSVDSD
jgi:hypothetical protein